MMEAQSNDSTDSDSDDYDPDEEELPFELQNIKKSPNLENFPKIVIPHVKENFAGMEKIVQDLGKSPNREKLDKDRYEESQLVSDDSFYSAESQIMPDKKPKEEPEEHQPSTTRTENPTGIRYHDDKIALPGKYYVTTKNGGVLPCEVFAARQNPFDR